MKRDLLIQDNYSNMSHGERRLIRAGRCHSFCLIFSIFRCIREIAKSDYYLCHVCPPVLPSVYPSGQMENRGCQNMDFHAIYYLIIYRKSVEKIQVSLNRTRISGTLHEDQ